MKVFVPGIPRPQGSKRAVIHKHSKRPVMMESSKHVGAWRQDIRSAVQEVWVDPPTDGPILLECTFYFPHRKSDFIAGKPERGLKPTAPRYKIGPPDASKLLRAVEDALEGVVYVNDSRIAVEHGEKLYGIRPGVLIELVTISESPIG